MRTDTGWGEIAPLPGFSRETLSDAYEEIVRLWPDLSRATLPSVRFGFASAQTPLHSVRIPLAALETPRPGFQTLKLKLGHLSVPNAIALVKSYRPQYRLRLDVNRAWTLEEALAFARAFTPDDFVYLEEPVQTFEELIRFSELTGFPVAVDESIGENWARIPSLKALVVKPTVVGSIPSLPPHLDLVLSSAYESGLGLLHIALSAPRSLPAGLDTYRALKDDILMRPIACEGGYFSWTYTDPPVNEAKLCPLAL